MMKPWQVQLVESLEAAADIDWQRRTWIDRVPPDDPAPGELLCQIFDDSAIDELMAGGVVFSEATDAVLRELSELADDLDERELNEEPALLLSNKRWVSFTRKAAEALAMVRKDLQQE
jgi:hypothetical protein